MRELKGFDVFNFARVLKAAGVRDQLKAEIQRFTANGDTDLESIGINGMLTLIEALSEKQAETAFWVFLAGPLEITPDEAANLSINQLVDAIRELAEKNDLRNFFRSASGILGQN